MTRSITAIAALGMLWSAGAVAQEEVTFPGGASEIREVRGHWILACDAQGGAKACNLRQEQRSGPSGPRLIFAELIPAGDGLTGSIVLPLGVDLQKGVTWQIDAGASQQAGFQACVAQLGCAVPLSLDASQAAALAAGTTLAVVFTPVGQQPMTYEVSLRGLTGALQRARELLAP